ncbi:drug resistance transporter, EmrB/QacA subfamily [Burkholderiales bacterium JOSHI_001]|nr:drug resistance transporter, EmrB/QacA subfamily [Burkholderiales bacterium JOSHI_001]
MSQAPAAAPPAPPPLHGTALLLGTLSLSLATFMNVLDSSIANVSIPAIAGDLGVSPSQGTWVITSFGVANAISVPLTGWLTQRFGAVRLFTMSVLLFVLTSWLCGFASSLEWLVVFRVLQGLVAGPMIPLSQTLLLSSYPRAKAGAALAIWGVTTLVAPVVGPLLGGWITDNVSWPWIFYINVPVGLGAAGVTWAIYRKRETATRRLPIDSMGLALLVLWVGSLQLMLDKGKELDWFSSPLIVVLALLAVVGFAVFLAWELTDAHPVVDLSLFKRRNFAAGALSLSLAYGLFFGNVVLMPLWLQQWMGYTATNAGMALAPVGVLAILLTPLVGKKVGQWDPRVMATGAFIVFAGVLFMRSQFTTQTDLAHILVPTIIQGAAMAFFFIPLTTLTLAGIEPARIPAAAGLSNFARITAGAMGTSIITTVWEDRAALHHAHLAEQLGSGAAGPLAEVLNTLLAGGMAREQALAQVNRLLDQQAFTRAADDVFLASAVIFLLLIAVLWLTRRPPRVVASGGVSTAPQADAAH